MKPFSVDIHAGSAGFEVATSLLSEVESADIFTTRVWFENLTRYGIETDANVLLVTVQPAEGVGGFCVPLRQRHRAPGAVYGQSLESLSNYYSSLYSPIGAPDSVSSSALVELLKELRRAKIQCNVIDLHPLEPSGSFFQSSKSSLLQAGYWIDQYFCFGNWYLVVDGRSFAEYEKQLPSRLRNTIKRGRRKLEATPHWSLKIHSEPGPGLEAAITAFETIYSRSWKLPEPFPNFISELCRVSALHGWLRLGLVHIEGQPAAAQIWLHRQGHSAIFKLAYDEDLKAYSAGSVLSAELMRHALDVDHAVEVDYLTGDEPYKADWMSNRRERLGLIAFRKGTLQGSLSALRHFVGRWLRKSRRRDKQATSIDNKEAKQSGNLPAKTA